MFDLRDIFYFAHFIGMAQFVKHDSAVQWRDRHDFLAITQDDFTDTYVPARLERLTQKGKGFRPAHPVRAGKIWRLIQRRMNLGRINKSFDLDNFGALEFDFCQILWRHDHILFRLELVTLDNLFRGERLAALLAFFLVTDGAVILLV